MQVTALLTAWLVGAAVTWPPLAVGIVLFVHADKRYHAEKAAGLHHREPLDNPWPDE